MESRNLTAINPTDTLGALASRLAGASRAFREAGLDYCCGGRQTLADACAAKGLDAQELLESIRAQSSEPAGNWESQPLPALIQHIVERYHKSLRSEIPALCEMAARVEEVHRDKPSCPHGLAEHLRAIHGAVLSHLEKEEQILFPVILAGRGPQAQRPIQVMELEHEDHGANLARTRSMTDSFTPPPEACATWKALYLRLAQLEADLMDHIHLENSVLFPRALCE